MGVLTHLDFFKDNKQLKTQKKVIKERFRKEVGDGKLFWLTGVQFEQYKDAEIKNLARFIAVQRIRPIEWRRDHPFVLVDRWDNVTDGQPAPEDDCVLAFYGYVRGGSYRLAQKVVFWNFYMSRSTCSGSATSSSRR